MTATPKRPAMTATQFLAGSRLQMIELTGLQSEDGEVPVVYVKEAKTDDAMAMAELHDDKSPEGRERLKQAQYLLAARCLYDEEGRRLLTDEQAPQLADMPASGFFQILNCALGDMKKVAGGKEGNA